MTRQFSNPEPDHRQDWWDDLADRLCEHYGPDEGSRRFLELRAGTEPDLIAWRNLGRG